MRPLQTLLIDNYDSYTYNLFQLLAQVNGVEPDVIRNDAVREVAELGLDRYDNVVISPGPGHPARSRDFGISAAVLAAARVPVLGVCLGHQGLALGEGGRVVAAPTPRHGHVSRIRHNDDLLFEGIPTEFGAVRYHSLCVAEPLPDDLSAIAWAEDGVVMALRHRRLPRWGVQFHPESIETEHGLRLLRNFHDLTLAATARRPSAAAATQASAQQTPAGVASRHYTALVSTLDTAVDTEAAFVGLFADSTDAFWLDSSRVEQGLSRFSFLGDGSGPLSETVRYRVDEGVVRVGSTSHRESVFAYLQRELRRRVIDAPPLPFDFVGGYVGYFGYELKADCGSPNRHTAATPDAMWLFADRFIVVDHQDNRTYLVALQDNRATAAIAAAWLAETADALTRMLPVRRPADVIRTDAIASRLARSRAEYIAAVVACQDLLRAGESYEICLSDTAEISATEPGLDTYRRLRRLNPAPNSAYLRMAEIEVACSSPERFLKISGERIVEAKPIKGTAPRGSTDEQDERLRRALAGDRKARAENLMVVDLIRNDLGRVCAVGSVHVPVLMAVETYETVHQLVSTVRGTLKPDKDAIDCVRACFPGGSMTGAPKLRTMEIIESVEDRARGVYSGAIGFLACNGTADLNIVIRTMVLVAEAEAGRATWQVGAGGAIVLDSDPEDEYDEMLLKAAAPARALFTESYQLTTALGS